MKTLSNISSWTDPVNTGILLERECGRMIKIQKDGSELGASQDMGDHKWWILGMGGVGIGCGLLLYVSRILRAIGVKLAVIAPSRGFCIEMGSSIVVVLGAFYGLPLSTTHFQIGATMGVALLEGKRGFNRVVIMKTTFGWIFTCVFVATLSGLISAFGGYAPNAYTTQNSSSV